MAQPNCSSLELLQGILFPLMIGHLGPTELMQGSLLPLMVALLGPTKSMVSLSLSNWIRVGKALCEVS